MSDFLSDGYSLNDYASEGQLFYKPTDKIRFEGALEALCDSHRHVVIVTDDKSLAERYYRYFITRIAIRDNIILDTRAPSGANDVLNRFNKILSASTVESARSADNNQAHHVMALIDTSNMSDHEWTVLGRLLKNFPGANIRMLAFVSESQLDVIDGVLDRLDGQVYRWILTSPTPEYLEALLEMGEQYNYQSETQQMAAAVGYHKLQQPNNDLADELDALDAHLDSLQNNGPSVNASTEDQTASIESDNDFNADLNALLGVIKQSHGIDDGSQVPGSDVVPEPTNEPAKTPEESMTKAPSRRLIWATGITGVALILVALFAPWEQPEVLDTQVQVSPRTFSTQTEPSPSSSKLQLLDAEAQPIDTQSSGSYTDAELGPTESLEDRTQGTDIKDGNAGQASSQEPGTTRTNARWNDDMARILAAEADSVSSAEELPSENIQAPESIETDETSTSAAVATTESDAALREDSAETESEIAIVAQSSVSLSQTVVMDAAEQTNRQAASVESDAPVGQEVASDTAESDTPADGEAIIQQASLTSYFIQLGVYANPTQAMLFMDTLPHQARAFQARLNKSGRQLSTVLSGPFESKALAEASAASVLGNYDVWTRGARSVKAELRD